MKELGPIVGVLVLAAALAGGYAAGRASGASAQAGPVAAATCREGQADVGLAPERIADLVRTAVRTEMAANAAARTADAPAAARPRAGTLPRAAAPAAATAAEDLLDDALAVGRWEREDQAELRSVLGQLDADRETVLLQRLAAALNSGELEIGFDGPMF